MVALIGALFVVAIGLARVATDPFGDSHDGRNGAVWATAAREIRTSGLMTSKIGAELSGGSVYANHPPLLPVETAALERALGERRWVSRAPAWAGTLVALGLLWALMGEVGLSHRVRALGLLAGAGCPMLLAYGSMLDTPISSLPFALAALWLWIRSPVGPTPGWWPACRALSLTLCVLASWQAALLAGVTVVVDLIHRRGRSAALGAVGVGVGLVVLISWQRWVFGSLGNLADQLRFRSNLDDRYDATFLGAMRHQVQWLSELLSPLALIAIPVGTWLLLRAGGARRDLTVVLLTTVLGYDLVLSGGAYFHDYWSYWVITIVVLSSAAGAEGLAAIVRRRSISPMWATTVPVMIGTLVALIALDPAQSAVRAQDEGVQAVALAHQPDEHRLFLYRVVASPAPWVTYETGKSADFVNSHGELAALAQSDPDQPVLTHCALVSAHCRERAYALVPARTAAELPQETTSADR